MSFIAIDAQTHDIITILPGRKNAEIKRFFNNRYSKRNREQVTRVVMDFNSQYAAAITEPFPYAELVADNFHLVQMGLRSLNQTGYSWWNSSNQTRENTVFLSTIGDFILWIMRLLKPVKHNGFRI